jgi:hypothetical protein
VGRVRRNRAVYIALEEPKPELFVIAKPEAECISVADRIGSGSDIKWNDISL